REVRYGGVPEPVALGHASLPAGRYVTLAVSDTGTGMSAETVAHIFEPFFTTKEQGKGTGLGLSTVYGIVEQSLGFIRVESELGHGTTFTIYLPRVEEPLPPPGDNPVPTAEAGRRLRTTARTVLGVDDEPEVREFATEILGRVGYRVLEAVDGPSAIDVVRRYEGDIHLLVTDMVMPGMAGRDLAGRRRRHPQVQTSPAGALHLGLRPGRGRARRVRQRALRVRRQAVHPRAAGRPRSGAARHRRRRGELSAAPASRSAAERAVDADVDQVRSARGHPPLDRRGHPRRLVHQLAGDALRFRQPDVVEAGIDQVHRHVGVVLGGEALQRLGALLEDAIGLVVEDHEHHRDRVVRRRPK